MNKRAIRITFFCVVVVSVLFILCVLGMKQLQVIGSMKNDSESIAETTEIIETEQILQETEQGSEEEEMESQEIKQETQETEQLSQETEEISAEEYYDLESKNDDNAENEVWDSQTTFSKNGDQGENVIINSDDPFPYYIKVNRLANCVTIYTKDEQGEYTVPVKAMVCSVGLRGNTPLGVFKTSTKYNWRYLYGNVYGQYAYRIKGPILFHSVPYYKKDKATLETEEYNKLGEAASKGCVRLSVEDAKWLIDNCPEGTTVEIYDSEDPGPLGKPEAIKIDTSSPNKGWDPTDPDEDNPWKNVVEETVQGENWAKEYVGSGDSQNGAATLSEGDSQNGAATLSEDDSQNSAKSSQDQSQPVITISEENLTIQIEGNGYSQEELIELAKSSAIMLVSSNVVVDDDLFYTNVLQVESVQKDYKEDAQTAEKKIKTIRVKVKISVEDDHQNRAEKTVTVVVDISDS